MPITPQQNVNVPGRLIWSGASGRSYEFEHYPIGTVFNQLPGVYIFCAQAIDGRWYAKYIGESDNLHRRLTQDLSLHHQWGPICSAGATHICAMVVGGHRSARLDVETDLRQRQNPPCNQQ